MNHKIELTMSEEELRKLLHLPSDAYLDEVTITRVHSRFTLSVYVIYSGEDLESPFHPVQAVRE